MKKLLIPISIIFFLFFLINVQASLPEGSSCSNNNECASSVCQGGYCQPDDILSDLVSLGIDEDEGTSDDTGTPPSGGGTRVRGPGDDYDITKIFSTINPNRLYCFDINELPIPVTKICFITNTELSDVKFNVKRQLERTSTISKPKDLVYQYFTIDTENIQDSDIEKANIQFRISKNWLEDNDLKEYKVILQRYTTQWNIHKPSVIAENDNTLFYNSYIQGFSWFGITSIPFKPATPYIPPVIQPVCGDGIIDSGEDCETCPADVTCIGKEVCENGRCIEKKRSLWWLFILILFALFAIVLYLIYGRKKKKVVVLKEKPKPIIKSKVRVTNKFKSVRIKEGLKKAAVARGANLSTTTLSKIENGEDVKEISKRAALRSVNALISKRTGVKNKYSFEQVFGQKPLTKIAQVKGVKQPLFSSKKAELAVKNYVKKARAARMTKKKIKAILMSKGWKEKQVDFILKQVK